MKKILMVMALAMVLVWGVGVKGADATIWQPTVSGEIDVNYIGSGAQFAIFDDSDLALTGSKLVMTGGPLGVSDTIGFSLNANGVDYDLALNGAASGFTLTSSNMFQVAWLDSNDVWKIDTSYSTDGKVSKIFWNYGTDSATLFQIDAKPVPVPAAAWLLGSGLLGLIGIRRRKK